ncbi:MAG: sialidase family protein [Candidatus Brocadiia bacterium]
MAERFLVSRDDTLYEAFPDLALAPSGRLVCAFSECTHHADRGYTRIMLATSDDRGRTWSPKRPLTEALRGDDRVDPFWNCPRLSTLDDGRLAAVVDRVTRGGGGRHGEGREQTNWLWLSADEGESWDGPRPLPVAGVVPDQLIELQRGPHPGRWVLSAHSVLGTPERPVWTESCWLSDDQGTTWTEPIPIAARPGLQLCEGSVVELPGGELACFLRENSGQGLDAYKALSRDAGRAWEGPVEFPLPGCHRPVAGMLADGQVLITHRFMQGGKGWLGWWTQNFFAALTDVESCLASRRDQAHTRILPVDFDRSPHSDTGYSGWVQFPDGELYIVNYIVDDAPKAHIRGYAVRPEEFLLQPSAAATCT